MGKKARKQTKEEEVMADETLNVKELEEAAGETGTDEKKTKGKRLEKDLVSEPGCVVISVVGGELGPRKFDPKTLPETVQEKLPAFALSHKLGDAAAGKAGLVAEEAITKVWEGLVAGDWSVRAPAQPKVAVSEVLNNFKGLTPEEQAAAAVLLKKLGISTPA